MGGIIGVPLEVEGVPDHHAGEDMAGEAEQADEQRSEQSRDHGIGAFVFEKSQVPEQSRRAEHRKGQQVIEQNAEEFPHQIGNPPDVGKSEDELQDSIDESRRESGTDTVPHGHKDDRCHRKERDRSAERCFVDLNEAEHRPQRDHHGALDEDMQPRAAFLSVCVCHNDLRKYENWIHKRLPNKKSGTNVPL